MRKDEVTYAEFFVKFILGFIPGIGMLFLFALMFDTIQTKYWRLFGLWITLAHMAYLVYVFYKLHVIQL